MNHTLLMSIFPLKPAPFLASLPLLILTCHAVATKADQLSIFFSHLKDHFQLNRGAEWKAGNAVH